jgi:hypothetical protein
MLNAGVVGYLPIENWLLRGVLREDDVLPSDYKDSTCGQPEQDPYGAFRRVLGHFYDPIFDRPLTPYGVTCSSVPGLGTCWKSVDWALGYVDSFATPPVPDTSRRNHFTWLDARENMWLALTGERGLLTPPYTAAAKNADSQERLFRWATMFRALGDAVHMLEDGAQPQHVRNDPHSPAGSSPEQQAYEPYTNSRVLRDHPEDVKGGLGGNYVRGFFSATAAISVRLPPIVTASAASGPYPVPVFATPLRFFTTRLKGDPSTVNPSNRFGLIDYTNGGFFTAGSRPEYSPANNFSFPPTPVANGTNGYTAVKQACVAGADIAGKVSNLKCLNFTHAVPDAVDPGYVDQLPPGFTAPPLLAESSFNIATTSFGVQHPSTEFAIGLDEFETMGNLTIPRAIAYSAGLINYFFRGQLSVTAPADGIYAMVNHGTPHTVNAQGYPCQGTATADGCPVFGFEQVRLNVQNTTPAMTESGTHNLISKATGGTGAKLVAVARYHRNPCYTTDLTGEYTHDVNNVIHPPAGCTNGDVRTPYQEISVSAPIAVTPGMLDGTQPVALTFDFSADPIPINATDLFLQSVYRGPLGDEPDGIAVGTVDVSEPTYVALFNGTDYVSKNNQWVIPSGTDPMPQVFTSIQICDGATQIYAASTPGLLVTHVLRLAMLRDFTNPTFSAAVSMANGVAFGTYQGSWYGRVVQADDEKGDNLHVGTLYFARGEVLGYHSVYYYQYVPPLPNPELDWSGLPTPATAASENMGSVIVPGSTACPF